MTKVKNKFSSGFTIIELLLYIGMISVFITGAILFTWDVIYGRERANNQYVVDQNARVAMAKIGYELRKAKDVDSLTSSSITLVENDESLTLIALNSGVLEITYASGGPYALTSNQVIVTDFTITDLTTENQNSKNIKIDLSLEQANPASPGGQKASTDVSFATELNSQFNLARQLLIDLSGATLTGSDRLTDIKLRNTGDEDLLIDKMKLSWFDGGQGATLESIQIAGGDLEWSAGGYTSGEEPPADLNPDFLLEAQSSQVPVNALQFQGNMEGALIYVTFILSDGSSTTGAIQLKGGTGGGSCIDTCIDLQYSSGVCRRREQQCIDNGETYESSGDPFCIQPPDDTCCCLP